jgi:hypothetical protein
MKWERPEGRSLFSMRSNGNYAERSYTEQTLHIADVIAGVAKR